MVGFFKQKSRAIQTKVLSYENTLCLVRRGVSKILETSFLTSKPRTCLSWAAKLLGSVSGESSTMQHASARALASSDGFESKSPFSPWTWDSIPSRERQEEQSPSDDARALMQNLSRCRIPLYPRLQQHCCLPRIDHLQHKATRQRVQPEGDGSHVAERPFVSSVVYKGLEMPANPTDEQV